MALFEILDNGLSPFEHVPGGPEFYESEIEKLLWENLPDLLGESMLKVRRQAHVAGGKPDIIALDAFGSVVTIEIKRSVDRKQLSQCLEYAGWARTTKLEEIASLYDGEPDAFWKDWPEFTETEKPRPLSLKPRLVLVAQYFDARTRSAIDFLVENGVPVTVVTISLHRDSQSRRIIEVGGIESPTLPATPDDIEGVQPNSKATYEVTLSDLVGTGFLQVGDELTWARPKKNTLHRCTISPEGKLLLENGTECSTPSGAAKAASGGGSFDGWNAWWSPRHEVMLHQLRSDFLKQQTETPG